MIILSIGMTGLGLYRYLYLSYEFGVLNFLVAYIISFAVIVIPVIYMQYNFSAVSKNTSHYTEFHSKYRIQQIYILLLSYFIVVLSLIILGLLIAFNLSSGHSVNSSFSPRAPIAYFSSKAIYSYIVILISLIFLLILLQTKKYYVGFIIVSTLTILSLIALISCIINVSIDYDIKLVKLDSINFGTLYNTALWSTAITQALFSSLCGYIVWNFHCEHNKYMPTFKKFISITFVVHIVLNITMIYIFYILIDNIGTVNDISLHSLLDHIHNGWEFINIFIPELIYYSYSYFDFVPALKLFILVSSLFLLTAIILITHAIIAILLKTSKLINSSLSYKEIFVISIVSLLLCITAIGLYRFKYFHFTQCVHYVVCYILPYILLRHIILISWLYDAEKIRYQLLKLYKIKLGSAFNIFTRIIAPALIIATIIYNASIDIPYALHAYSLSTNMLNISQVLTCIVVLILISRLINRVLK